jgi:hypothetical protein
MRHLPVTGAVLITACLVAGCESDSTGTAAATSPSSASASPSESSGAEESPLEGTWTSDLRPAAIAAYIRRAGWGRAAEKALLDPAMSGPGRTQFRIDFAGDQFRMSQVSTDEQWQSGTWRIKDGRLYLDDSFPVGELTFRLHLNGDTATFDRPHDTSNPPEFMPGVPGEAPGATLWGSTVWTRSP